MARPGPAAGFHKITHPQKREVLRAYSVTMRIGLACESARISRFLHYHWLKSDADYKDAMGEARAMAADILEEEAVRRGLGTLDQHSDTLLIFLLKGAKPEVYKERYEHSGPGGGPLQVEALATDVRQARLAALLAKRNGQAAPAVEEPA